MRKIKLLGVYTMIWLGLCFSIFIQESRANPLTQQEVDELMREVATEKRIREQKMQAASEEYLQKGIGLYREEKYLEALQKFQNALEANPENRRASSWLRRTNAQIERKERRLRAEQKAAVREPEDIFEEGKDAFRMGDYAIAEARFIELLQKDPGNEEAERWLKAARREKEKREAILAGREAIADLKVAEAKRETREKEMMLEVERAYVPERRVGPLVREEIIEGVEPEELRRREMKANLEKLPPIPAVNFVEAEVRDILKTLMEMTGVNILLDEHSLRRLYPEGFTITMRTVSPMPLLDLLDIVLRPSMLGYRIEPAFIWVSDREIFLREDVVTRTYQLRYGVRRIRVVEPIERRQREDDRERGRERERR